MSDELKPPKPLPVILKAQRDGRSRYHLQRLHKAAPHLRDPKFRPLALTFVRITFLLERAYHQLAHQDLVSPITNEIRQSVATFANLAKRQEALADKLGLSPATARSIERGLPVDHEAYARIMRMDELRNGGETVIETDDEKKE
jgi:hypothetical protein